MTALDINALQQYSGIKAHTIRIWEYRFNLFRPSRTPGNRRVYTLDDLKLLLDVAVLLRYGNSISKLSRLPSQELLFRISQLDRFGTKYEIKLNTLIVAYVKGDIATLDSTITDCLNVDGIHNCVINLIIPFINKIGLFYYLDRSSTTHLIVTVLRKKLLYAIEKVYSSVSNKTALLFLPANQHFDLILLYLQYELLRSGNNVLYLGTDVPVNTLNSVIEKYNPDILLTYIGSPSRISDSVKRDLLEIAANVKNLIVTIPYGNHSSELSEFTVLPYFEIGI